MSEANFSVAASPSVQEYLARYDLTLQADRLALDALAGRIHVGLAQNVGALVLTQDESAKTCLQAYQGDELGPLGTRRQRNAILPVTLPVSSDGQFGRGLEQQALTQRLAQALADRAKNRNVRNRGIQLASMLAGSAAIALALPEPFSTVMVSSLSGAYVVSVVQSLSRIVRQQMALLALPQDLAPPIRAVHPTA